MYLFFISNILCNVPAKFSFNKTFVIPYNEDEKNVKLNEYILVYSDDNSPYFGLLTKDGQSLTFDKTTKKLKLEKVDNKLTNEAICTITHDTESAKCKDIKKAKEGKEEKENKEEEEENEEKNINEDDRLIFYLKTNNAHSATIGIKGTNFCLHDNNGEFEAKECPKPGFGGDNFGVKLYIEPNISAQEVQENGQHNKDDFEHIKNIGKEEGRDWMERHDNPQAKFVETNPQSNIVEENPQAIDIPPNQSPGPKTRNRFMRRFDSFSNYVQNKLPTMNQQPNEYVQNTIPPVQPNEPVQGPIVEDPVQATNPKPYKKGLFKNILRVGKNYFRKLNEEDVSQTPETVNPTTAEMAPSNRNIFDRASNIYNDYRHRLKVLTA
ncbi:putative SP-containing protein [Vairimorpha necatrix]|uniref:SP-containing protein n=1 Tax=Vairimorpha necatrix TaxID=6039 RepID=A0AAX4JEU5_9MICR